MDIQGPMLNSLSYRLQHNDVQYIRIFADATILKTLERFDYFRGEPWCQMCHGTMPPVIEGTPHHQYNMYIWDL